MPVQEQRTNTSCKGVESDILGNPVSLRQQPYPVSRSKISPCSLEDDLGDLTLEDIYYYQDVDEGMPLTPEEGFPVDYSGEIFTLEDLKVMYNSCFTCGVSWVDDHVSLDCSECGGYAMKRPCPVCEGVCSSSWTRNITMSHHVSHAHWEGSCALSNSDGTNSSIEQSSSPVEQSKSEKEVKKLS